MQTNQPFTSREEIRAFVEKEYPELSGGRISIGFLGDHYRVVVEDASLAHHPYPSRNTAIGSNRDDCGPRPQLTYPKEARGV